MYKLLITCVFTLMLVQDERSIAWSHDKELEWSDFNATPTYGTAVAAVTSSGITFGYSSKMSETRLVDYSAYVDAHFYPDKSWFIEGRANAIILDHERLHFDITELHVRKLKKRIAQTTFTLNIESEMNSLHMEVNDELAQMQQIYDLESDHSQNIAKQKEWQRFINLELAKLSYYSR